MTGSAAKAGVVGLAKWLPVALRALPAGVLADRLNRKRLMIFCDAIRVLAAASVVVALWLGRPACLQIVAVRSALTVRRFGRSWPLVDRIVQDCGCTC